MVKILYIEYIYVYTYYYWVALKQQACSSYLTYDQQLNKQKLICINKESLYEVHLQLETSINMQRRRDCSICCFSSASFYSPHLYTMYRWTNKSTTKISCNVHCTAAKILTYEVQYTNKSSTQLHFSVFFDFIESYPKLYSE